MSFCNNEILITNIESLMRNNSMTQSELGEILGMSQSNISKALSRTDKKNFTLDQIVGISQHFGVSIDSLIGNDSEKSQELSPRSIADFVYRVIEGHFAKTTTVEIEEAVYEPKRHYNVFNGYTDALAVEESRVIKYPALYFPNYWEIPDPDTIDKDTFDELTSEASQIGNETNMIPVNDFIWKWLQIFNIYEHKGIDEDAYRVVVDNYLSKLKDH